MWHVRGSHLWHTRLTPDLGDRGSSWPFFHPKRNHDGVSNDLHHTAMMMSASCTWHPVGSAWSHKQMESIQFAPPKVQNAVWKGAGSRCDSSGPGGKDEQHLSLVSYAAAWLVSPTHWSPFPVLVSATLFGDKVLANDQVKMRSSGWALTHQGMEYRGASL